MRISRAARRATRSDPGVGAVQLTLPDRAPPSPREDLAPGRTPIKLVVTLTTDRLQIWSITGREGTLQAPLVDEPWSEPHAAARRVRAALEEVVDRRWPSGEGRPDEDPVILMADARVPAAAVIGVLSGVVVRADGRPLFPDAMLSAGFE